MASRQWTPITAIIIAPHTLPAPCSSGQILWPLWPTPEQCFKTTRGQKLRLNVTTPVLLYTLLISSHDFLASWGHCPGMCEGPRALAGSESRQNFYRNLWVSPYDTQEHTGDHQELNMCRWHDVQGLMAVVRNRLSPLLGLVFTLFNLVMSLPRPLILWCSYNHLQTFLY